MKTYAKLEEGALRVMERVPNISNPTDAQRAAYASEHGYKELRRTDRPGRYYNIGYKETAKLITETWTAWELDAAKKDARDIVQARLDTALDTRSTIECDGFPSGIVYDRNALINASGLAEGDTFIDAADGLHTLTAEDVEHIAAALKAHRLGLYAAATQSRTAIDAAGDVDTVEAVLG